MSSFTAPLPYAPASRGQQVLALLEILAVYAGGAVLGVLLARIAGVELRNPMQAIAENPAQDLIPIAGQLLGLLFWQYLGWLVCASSLHWLRGAPNRAKAGPAPRPAPGRLLFLGLVTASLATVPQHAIGLAQHYLGLGETAPWRAALLASSWDFDFWVLMAVGSFGLIPLVEEAFYRGWMLGRVQQVARPAVAVLFTGALFAFSHSQYLRLDALNVLTLASVVYGGCVYALITLHARSLWPAILAHAIINVPLSPALEWVQISAMLVFLVLSFRHWQDVRESVRALATGTSLKLALAAVAGGAGIAFAFHWQQELVAVLGLLLWLMLIGYYGVLRLRRARAPMAGAPAADNP